MEIEAELDQIHPDWSKAASSRLGRGIVGTRGITDQPTKARAKYLLQRRKYLYAGNDWDVIVRTFDRADGSVGMVAEPLRPKREHTAASIRKAATQSRLSEGPQQASLPRIAHTLGATLEQVETWVSDCPSGANVYAWARRKAQEAPPKPKRARKRKPPAKK